jgi:hypothetical protein
MMKSKQHVTPEWIEERRRSLPGELEALIAAEPGRPKTWYIYRRVAEGGLRGLTEEKYAAMNGLLSAGRVKAVERRASGRNGRFWGLYVAGAVAEPVPPNPTDDEALRGWLVGRVRSDPGRGPTHYPRITRAEGSPGGSQERKEALLGQLIAEGHLRLEPLAKARGRCVVGVFPAEGLAFSGRGGL